MGPPEPELEPEAGTKVEAENLSQKEVFWYFLSPRGVARVHFHIN